LKESERVAAEKRAQVGLKVQTWENGVGGEQVSCEGIPLGTGDWARELAVVTGYGRVDEMDGYWRETQAGVDDEAMIWLRHHAPPTRTRLPQSSTQSTNPLSTAHITDLHLPPQKFVVPPIAEGAATGKA
jgi:hypothetical protein